eukprot:1282506-Pleurochrysis_carterae.AAC.1
MPEPGPLCSSLFFSPLHFSRLPLIHDELDLSCIELPPFCENLLLRAFSFYLLSIPSLPAPRVDVIVCLPFNTYKSVISDDIALPILCTRPLIIHPGEILRVLKVDATCRATDVATASSAGPRESVTFSLISRQA